MYTAKFIEKIQETPTDWSFRFTKPDNFVYRGGQYTVIKLTLTHPDERGTNGHIRTCSLSSSPTEDFLQFTFTMRDSGFKKTLMDMQPDDEVTLYPIKGKMSLDYVSSRVCIMIAGGIGVAPYRGILREVRDLSLDTHEFVLLYSDKTIPELCFKSEFDEMNDSIHPISVVYTLTRHVGDGWYGKTGRINAEFISHHVTSLDEVTFMVCGPVEMVQDTIKHLKSMGVAQDKIIFELFTGY